MSKPKLNDPFVLLYLIPQVFPHEAFFCSCCFTGYTSVSTVTWVQQTRWNDSARMDSGIFFSQANIHTWDVYSTFEQRVELFLRVSGNFSTKTKLIHHFLFCWTSLLCRMNSNMRVNHLLVSSATATHPKKETRNGPEKFWKREIDNTLKYQNVIIKWLVRRTLEFGFWRDRRTDFREKRWEEADGLAWRIYTLSEFSRDDCWVRDYNPLKPVLQPPHSHPLTTRHDFAVFSLSIFEDFFSRSQLLWNYVK